MSKNLPDVTLLIVVRNEKGYIEKSINSLLNQTYPRELTEIIVVDGMSIDGTKQWLQQKIEKLKKEEINIKLLDNPKKILSSGWNIGIKNAKADIVCRIDTHSEICPEYVELGINELLKRKEDKVVCVGGILENIGEGIIGNSIADLFSSKFGIGNSAFRTGVGEPQYTDTAVFGLYWKWVFNAVGYFNEDVKRNQDIVLHAEIRRQGYKFITHPDMKIKYYVRNTIRKLIKKAFSDGYWVLYSGESYLRHKIPLFFVLYLFFVPLLVCLLESSVTRYLYLFPLGFYFILAIYFSIKDGRLWSKLILLLLFPIFHISYGIGSVWGVIKLISKRQK